MEPAGKVLRFAERASAVSNFADPTGYQHPAYIQSLAEFGEPLELQHSGGWLLRRRIPNSEHHDAIGPYPYLVCRNWKALATDLERDKEDLISIAVAPDPFGTYQVDDLHEAFPDRVDLYKHHFVTDLLLGVETLISRHRQEIRKAARLLTIEICDSPTTYLKDWTTLFSYVVRRFDLRGIQAFSERTFAQQLSIPGATMWVVRSKEKIVAASFMMIQGEVAYAHLMAATPAGRNMGASYLIYAANLTDLANRVRWIDWGGVPGTTDSETGLAAFKRSWSTHTRPAFFCGRILNRTRYDSLTRQTPRALTSFFPSYRHPNSSL